VFRSVCTITCDQDQQTGAPSNKIPSWETRRDVSRDVCALVRTSTGTEHQKSSQHFTMICFTICLFNSPDLAGNRAPQTTCFTVCFTSFFAPLRCESMGCGAGPMNWSTREGVGGKQGFCFLNNCTAGIRGRCRPSPADSMVQLGSSPL